MCGISRTVVTVRTMGIESPAIPTRISTRITNHIILKWALTLASAIVQEFASITFRTDSLTGTFQTISQIASQTLLGSHRLIIPNTTLNSTFLRQAAASWRIGDIVDIGTCVTVSGNTIGTSADALFTLQRVCGRS